MEGHEILMLLPPALAIVAAWFSSRAIKKSAAGIDRERARLRAEAKASGFKPDYIGTPGQLGR